MRNSIAQLINKSIETLDKKHTEQEQQELNEEQDLENLKPVTVDGVIGGGVTPFNAYNNGTTPATNLLGGGTSVPTIAGQLSQNNPYWQYVQAAQNAGSRFATELPQFMQGLSNINYGAQSNVQNAEALAGNYTSQGVPTLAVPVQASSNSQGQGWRQRFPWLGRFGIARATDTAETGTSNPAVDAMNKAFLSKTNPDVKNNLKGSSGKLTIDIPESEDSAGSVTLDKQSQLPTNTSNSALATTPARPNFSTDQSIPLPAYPMAAADAFGRAVVDVAGQVQQGATYVLSQVQQDVSGKLHNVLAKYGSAQEVEQSGSVENISGITQVAPKPTTVSIAGQQVNLSDVDMFSNAMTKEFQKPVDVNSLNTQGKSTGSSGKLTIDVSGSQDVQAPTLGQRLQSIATDALNTMTATGQTIVNTGQSALQRLVDSVPDPNAPATTEPYSVDGPSMFIPQTQNGRPAAEEATVPRVAVSESTVNEPSMLQNWGSYFAGIASDAKDQALKGLASRIQDPREQLLSNESSDAIGILIPQNGVDNKKVQPQSATVITPSTPVQEPQTQQQQQNRVAVASRQSNQSSVDSPFSGSLFRPAKASLFDPEDSAVAKAPVSGPRFVGQFDAYINGPVRVQRELKGLEKVKFEPKQNNTNAIPQEVSPAVKSQLKSLQQRFETGYKNFKRGFEGILKNALRDVTAENVQQYKSILTSNFDAVTSAIGSAIDVMTTTPKYDLGKFSKFVDSVEQLKMLLTKNVEPLVDVLNQQVTMAQDNANSLRSMLNDQVNAVKENVGNLTSILTEQLTLVQENANNLGSMLNKQRVAAKEFVKGIPGSIRNMLNTHMPEVNVDNFALFVSSEIIMLSAAIGALAFVYNAYMSDNGAERLTFCMPVYGDSKEVAQQINESTYIQQYNSQLRDGRPAVMLFVGQCQDSFFDATGEECKVMIEFNLSVDELYYQVGDGNLISENDAFVYLTNNSFSIPKIDRVIVQDGKKSPKEIIEKVIGAEDNVYFVSDQEDIDDLKLIVAKYQ